MSREGESTDTLDRWPEFATEVRARLDHGRREYGDESFDKEPRELLAELEQEAMDLAGWGYVLWHRCRALKEKLR